MSDNPSFVLRKCFDVGIEKRPVPKIIDPYSVKVAVKYTGICGSDVHYYVHGSIGKFVVKDPMTLGHESSGIVTELGPKVTELKIGDRVCLEPGIPCRRCEQCKRGKYNLCPEMAFAATPPYDGTLCRYYILPQDFCTKLPEAMSLEEGALMEPLSVAVHASKLAEVCPGGIVAIFGVGPVGLLCCAVAKAFGAYKVIAADINEERLDFAKHTTKVATHTHLIGKSDTPDQTAEKMKELLGEEPDHVIDASGNPNSINASIRLIKDGGNYVQAGMGPSDITFPIMTLCSKEITARGCFRYGPGVFKLAVELVTMGLIDVKSLISKKYSFEDAEEAFKLTQSGKAIKVLIEGPK